MQAKWMGDSWRCRQVAGDSFVTTTSPHLSLFTICKALAGPWGHRDPAFEEFIDQVSQQMSTLFEDSGDAGTM